MDPSIVAPGPPTCKPLIRFHRINPLTFPDGLRLCIADGVIEVEASAYLGQVRAPSDTPDEFRVAAFTSCANQMIPAPRGWAAHVLASRDGDTWA